MSIVKQQQRGFHARIADFVRNSAIPGTWTALSKVCHTLRETSADDAAPQRDDDALWAWVVQTALTAAASDLHRGAAHPAGGMAALDVLVISCRDASAATAGRESSVVTPTEADDDDVSAFPLPPSRIFPRPPVAVDESDDPRRRRRVLLDTTMRPGYHGFRYLQPAAANNDDSGGSRGGNADTARARLCSRYVAEQRAALVDLVASGGKALLSAIYMKGPSTTDDSSAPPAHHSARPPAGAGFARADVYLKWSIVALPFDRIYPSVSAAISARGASRLVAPQAHKFGRCSLSQVTNGLQAAVESTMRVPATLRHRGEGVENGPCEGPPPTPPPPRGIAAPQHPPRSFVGEWHDDEWHVGTVRTPHRVGIVTGGQLHLRSSEAVAAVEAVVREGRCLAVQWATGSTSSTGASGSTTATLDSDATEAMTANVAGGSAQGDGHVPEWLGLSPVFTCYRFTGDLPMGGEVGNNGNGNDAEPMSLLIPGTVAALVTPGQQQAATLFFARRPGFVRKASAATGGGGGAGAVAAAHRPEGDLTITMGLSSEKRFVHVQPSVVVLPPGDTASVGTAAAPSDLSAVAATRSVVLTALAEGSGSLTIDITDRATRERWSGMVPISVARASAPAFAPEEAASSWATRTKLSATTNERDFITSPLLIAAAARGGGGGPQGSAIGQPSRPGSGGSPFPGLGGGLLGVRAAANRSFQAPDVGGAVDAAESVTAIARPRLWGLKDNHSSREAQFAGLYPARGEDIRRLMGRVTGGVITSDADDDVGVGRTGAPESEDDRLPTHRISALWKACVAPAQWAQALAFVSEDERQRLHQPPPAAAVAKGREGDDGHDVKKSGGTADKGASRRTASRFVRVSVTARPTHHLLCLPIEMLKDVPLAAWPRGVKRPREGADDSRARRDMPSLTTAASAAAAQRFARHLSNRHMLARGFDFRQPGGGDALPVELFDGERSAEGNPHHRGVAGTGGGSVLIPLQPIWMR